jgi:simple sugar transport system substrate-binding protein
MLRKFSVLMLLSLLLLVGTVMPSQAQGPTFYWISHGSEGDPIWIFAINGAKTAADSLGVTLNASFHHGDIASQKEAFTSAIATGADGIAVSSPEVGVLTDEVAMAKEKGIPVVFFNTDDPATGRAAYVGADLQKVGAMWAQYLVDNSLVKEGDVVWMPVEVPGGQMRPRVSLLCSIRLALSMKYSTPSTTLLRRFKT